MRVRYRQKRVPDNMETLTHWTKFRSGSGRGTRRLYVIQNLVLNE